MVNGTRKECENPLTFSWSPNFISSCNRLSHEGSFTFVHLGEKLYEIPIPRGWWKPYLSHVSSHQANISNTFKYNTSTHRHYTCKDGQDNYTWWETKLTFKWKVDIVYDSTWIRTNCILASWRPWHYQSDHIKLQWSNL